MGFSGYILQSELTGSFYVGQTDDLAQRVVKHNRGEVRSTKPYRPWKLVYWKQFETRREAMAWEKQVKGRKHRAFIEKLIREFTSERSAAR